MFNNFHKSSMLLFTFSSLLMLSACSSRLPDKEQVQALYDKDYIHSSNKVNSIGATVGIAHLSNTFIAREKVSDVQCQKPIGDSKVVACKVFFQHGDNVTSKDVNFIRTNNTWNFYK